MRDDFSSDIKETLARPVNMRCSNPTCRKTTSGPNTLPEKSINIGVAAHITAASQGGPRYDNSISPKIRKSIHNGIWLCQNCAKLIDSDPRQYEVELLLEWKRNAEEFARKNLEQLIKDGPGKTPVLHLRDLFLVGCAIGQRLAIVPTDKNDNVIIDEFLAASERIGLGSNEIVVAIKDLKETMLCSQFGKEKSQSLANIEQFLSYMMELAQIIRNSLSHQNYRWFYLGVLLFEIATFGIVDQHLEVRSQNIKHLRWLIDLMVLPSFLKNELRSFCLRADLDNPLVLIGKAQNIASQLYALL